MKKILVVTTRFPFGIRRGACEQDRIEGMHLLKKLGYEVRVITMCYPKHRSEVRSAEEETGATIIPVLYSRFYKTSIERCVSRIIQACVPIFWDGASFEYRNRPIRDELKKQIRDFSPDVVWFDYSNLWPLYDIVRKAHIPIVTRSINYEPDHYLNQSKHTPVDYLKYGAKAFGERRMLIKSDLVFAITPKEKATYETLGTTKVVTLPLRRLSAYIGRNSTVHSRPKLNVYFIGSNFHVPHMRRGLLFVLNEVNSLLQKRFPNTFTLHIIGGKNMHGHDEALVSPHMHNGVVYHGFVPDLETALNDMDIAISPSLIGEGMQQKVFEPIVRGIPTITSPRVLAGYPLHDGVHLLTPEPTAEAFVEALGKLRDAKLRAQLSREAILASQKLFSEETYLKCIGDNLDALMKKTV